MPKFVMAVCLALLLSACVTLQRTPAMTATVTGVSAGRAGVPGEKMYVLRSAGGYVYMTSQIIDEPPKVGDLVEIEAAGKGRVRIVGPAAR